MRSVRTASRAHEIAQRFFFGAGNADRVQLAGQQQPHEQFGIAAIGLDTIAAGARDLARRRDHAIHVTALEFAREAVAGRAGLIRRPDRPAGAARRTGRPPRGPRRQV